MDDGDKDEEARNKIARDAKLEALILKAQETLNRTAHFGQYAAFFKKQKEAELAARKAKGKKQGNQKEKRVTWEKGYRISNFLKPNVEPTKRQQPSWNISQKLVKSPTSPVMAGRLYAAKTREIFLSKPQDLIHKTSRNYAPASKAFQQLLSEGHGRYPAPHLPNAKSEVELKVQPPVPLNTVPSRYAPKFDLSKPRVSKVDWSGNKNTNSDQVTPTTAGSNEVKANQKGRSRSSRTSKVAKSESSKQESSKVDSELEPTIQQLKDLPNDPVHKPLPATIGLPPRTARTKSTASGVAPAAEEPLQFVPVEVKSRRFPHKKSTRAIGLAKPSEVELNWGKTIAEIEALTSRAAHVQLVASNPLHGLRAASKVSFAPSTYYEESPTPPIENEGIPPDMAATTTEASREFVSTMYDIYSNLKDMAEDVKHPSQHVINYEESLKVKTSKLNGKLQALQKNHIYDYQSGVQPKTSEHNNYIYPDYTKMETLVG